MRRITLVDGVTDGVTVTGINVLHNQPTTLAASGLSGSETATLQIYVNGNYVDVYDTATDELVKLASTGNVLAITIPGTYGLVLTTSASAVSIDKYTSGV